VADVRHLDMSHPPDAIRAGRAEQRVCFAASASFRFLLLSTSSLRR
jgi:hypothetical protein